MKKLLLMAIMLITFGFVNAQISEILPVHIIVGNHVGQNTLRSLNDEWVFVIRHKLHFSTSIKRFDFIVKDNIVDVKILREKNGIHDTKCVENVY